MFAPGSQVCYNNTCHSVASPLILRIDSVLEAIHSLQQLQYLHVTGKVLQYSPVMSTQSQAWRIQNLLSVLHAAQTNPQLMQLTIRFAVSWNAIAHQMCYSMNRDSFLNDVLACSEMKNTLRQFPALQHVYFTLRESNTDVHYREEWWRSQIESRLYPDLHAAISVTHWLAESMWSGSALL